MAKDYYNILGIDKNASADEIKSAYRRLAKKYHPDVYATAGEEEKKNAEAKFKEVQHAYEVLSDPQKKAAFDQYGSEDGPMGGGFGGGFNGTQGFSGFGDMFSDIFSAFTGGSARSNPNTPRQGDDIEVEVQLTFKEAFEGVSKEVTFSRVEKCATCGGSGAKSNSDVKVCTKCGGRGRVVVQQRTMLGVMQTERVCDMCGGKGKIVTDPCPDCKGKGRVRKQRTVSVKIPAGVDNGQMISIRNEGSAGVNGGDNGSLIVVLRVKPHPLFKRNGFDLSYDFPITVTQAILGDKVEVPTPTGMVKIDIPEGTQDSTTIRIKGKGFKNLRKDSYGDLYVKLVIDIPKNLSSKQRKELKDLEAVFDKAKYDKVEKFNKKLKEI